MSNKKNDIKLYTNQKEKIESNFQEFYKILNKAEKSFFSTDYELSAIQCQIAAEFAWRNHSGIFFSKKLESLLEGIGQNIFRNYSENIFKNKTFKNDKGSVLHVLTQAYSIGGHTKMVWRWINMDHEKKHFVLITRQNSIPIPQKLIDSVQKQGGEIYCIDRWLGGLISRAKRFQKIASRFDFIVLNLHPSDVVPIIGLSKKNMPPIIFVNHADHVFSIGTNISDLIVHIRESGKQLSIDRRQVDKEKAKILPIPIKFNKKNLQFKEAKEKLGFNSDTVILLSIASSYKFKGKIKKGFFDVVLPILKKHDNVKLLMVGSKEIDFIKYRNKNLMNKVIFYGKRADTIKFYQAADIYLDSIPFPSITSLLEAGSLSTPLVSFDSYPKECGVLCADDPGLKKGFLHTGNIRIYRKFLSQLISNKKNEREIIGKILQHNILNAHNYNWPIYLKNIYKDAIKIKTQKKSKSNSKCNHHNILDYELIDSQTSWGTSCPFSEIFNSNYRLLPIKERYRNRKNFSGKSNNIFLHWIFNEFLFIFIGRLKCFLSKS